MKDSTIDDKSLFFLPLGGSGEIGMNLNLFACRGKWLMVDLGMTFAEDWVPGVDLIFPDPAFIEERRSDLVGIVLTHGHEDHIGAVPYLWDRLQVPIYATAFTAELVRGKLEEAGLLKRATIKVCESGSPLDLSPFRVTYIPLAHSIPEGHGLKIDTPLGTIFHTGDWKLDETPMIGRPTSDAEMAAIGEGGILAMTGDSTNVFNASESGSEQAVRDSLVDLVKGLDGRVVITTFASNVARLQSLGEVTRASGRELVCLGRSIHRIVDAAKKTGYLKEFPTLVDEEDAAHLPPERTLIVCTGCQGEPRAALSRLASGEHRAMTLEPGDTVIFSSKIIPGNEITLGRLMNALSLADIDVITERDAFVHVSGHPGRAELKRMYDWIRPRISIPVHGEARHLRRHAKFAREQGVDVAIAPRNGDIIRLAPDPVEIVGRATAGRLALDGETLTTIDDNAIIERRRMMFNGLVNVVIVTDGEGELLSDPQIFVRGLPSRAGSDDLMEDLQEAAEDAVEKSGAGARQSEDGLSEKVRISVRRACRNLTGKNPMVDVRIVRLEEELI